MKTFICLSLVPAAVFAAAAQRFVWSDAKGDVSLSSTGGAVTNPGTSTPSLDLRGRVVAVSKEQAVSIAADRLKCQLKLKKGRLQFATATATGNVVATQNGKAQKATLSGSSASFQGKLEGGTIDMRGPVRMQVVNASGAKTLSASGAHAKATVAKGNNPLQSAVVDGGVRIEVQEPATKTLAASTMVITGSTLNYQPGRVTMSGGVHATSSRSGDFRASTLTVGFNANGEVVSITSNGGGE